MTTADLQRNDEVLAYVDAYRDPKYRMGSRRLADMQRILGGLPKGSLLDVGTGRGETLAFALSIGFGPVVGTEVVPALLREEGSLRVTFAHAHALPFADDSFDSVTCFDVLEHLVEDDLLPALREMLRVSRSHCVVSASEDRSLWNGRELHISRRPKDQWLALIREAWGPSAECIGTAGKSPAFGVRKG